MNTVTKAIKKLIEVQPYYGLFAMGVNREWSPDDPSLSIGLDGINFKLRINKEYWYKHNENERMGLIMHELGHILFFHITDLEDWHSKCPNHNLLNICMDLEVNSWIPAEYHWKESMAFQLIKLLRIPLGMGTQWYIKFFEGFKKAAKSDSNGENNSKNNSDNNQSAEGQGENAFNRLTDEEKESVKKAMEKRIDHNWDKMVEQLKGKTELAKSQVEFQMIETAKEVMKSRGIVPGQFAEKISELMKPKPPVFNWRSYFRRFLGVSYDVYQKKTRRKESKRFSESPGLKLKKKHKILVAIDTSGSVCSKDFQDFFNELKYTYKAGAHIHILECDTRIVKEYDYTGKTPEQLYGRGGTSFLEPVEYYNKHLSEYQTLVYFTDGYGDQNECKPKGQMLWIITSDGNKESEYPGFKICIPTNN